MRRGILWLLLLLRRLHRWERGRFGHVLRVPLRRGTGHRGQAPAALRQFPAVPHLLEKRLDLFVLRAHVTDECEQRLPGKLAFFRTLEGRLRGQPSGELLVKVGAAVVVVEGAGVLHHLVANEAVERSGLLQRPVGAELPLHEGEDDLVAEAVVTAEVDDVPALEWTARALEGPRRGNLPQDVVAKVGEEVDALVPGLVHRRRELLPAQLAVGRRALDVDLVGDRQHGEVREVPELGPELFAPLLRLLLLLLHLDDVQIPRGRHELGQLDPYFLQRELLQVLVAPDEVPQPRLPLGVLERAGGALLALLGDPVGDLGAEVEVHKVAAEIEAGEVPVVAGAALGELLVLRLRPVRRQRVLGGGGGRLALAAGTAVPATQEAHVDVERPRGIGGPQLLDDLGVRDAVVEQEAHLLRAHVLAQGALERRLQRQAGEQHAPEVQHHVLLQVLLLPESVLAILAG